MLSFVLLVISIITGIVVIAKEFEAKSIHFKMCGFLDIVHLLLCMHCHATWRFA